VYWGTVEDALGKTSRYIRSAHLAFLYQSLLIGLGGPLAIGRASVARSGLAFAMSTYMTRPFNACQELALLSSFPDRHKEGKKKKKQTVIFKE
jgi:hypothetical protein